MVSSVIIRLMLAQSPMYASAATNVNMVSDIQLPTITPYFILLPANNVQASMVYHSRIPVSYNTELLWVDSLSCFLTYTATTHHYLLASILLTQFDSLPMAWITGFGIVASLIYMDINNKGRLRPE
ncbi:hypothetical protein DER44DRAFT_251193 [Fusarium oxysporum]|nr:hypothetical protein DER44DRAFT_251193 [Fusarium oxysporum]